MKPKRIMCAVDFSEPAELASNYALELARTLGAELVLLHAFDMPADYGHAGQTHPADPGLVDRLDMVLASVTDVPISRVLHAGTPGEVSVWAAANQACDLIVVGTHGRTGFKHLLLGSVAEYVVSHARVPVLTVRQQQANEPAPPEPRVEPVPAPRYL